ncbi:MAG: prephenate dehydrogenase/arogenate dehydrogenase family protein [Candidatus Tumulicola sp.]
MSAAPPIVGIVGTGLIGGSIGLRARREGAWTIGFDNDPAALAAAFDAGAIAEAVSRDELYARADTVVMAAYLGATVTELERLAREGSHRATLIVDVASVKVPVCAAGHGVRHFVATHPMGGSERGGAAAARADLFDARIWAYVPSLDPALDARARAFIASQGARPLAIEAVEHDRIVGFTSHLPQVLAWAYARHAAPRASEAFTLLGGAASRELLRVGASGSAMWLDVLRANRANVAPALERLGAALVEAGTHLSAGNVEAALKPIAAMDSFDGGKAP